MRAPGFILSLAVLVAPLGSAGAAETPAETPPVAATGADRLAALAVTTGLGVDRAVSGHDPVRCPYVQGALAAATEADAVGPDLRGFTGSPVKGVGSSGFGWRRDPFHGRRKYHKGTDFRAKRGTPVYAAAAGTVIKAESQNGYGQVVYLDHGAGLVSRYAHLSKINVALGTVLEAGEAVGAVGATGRATGPHLHFEVRVDGAPVDPVMAFAVAELQRDAPHTAGVLARSLTPTIQARLQRDLDDDAQRAKRRPGRRGQRERNNW